MWSIAITSVGRTARTDGLPADGEVFDAAGAAWTSPDEDEPGGEGREGGEGGVGAPCSVGGSMGAAAAVGVAAVGAAGGICRIRAACATSATPSRASEAVTRGIGESFGRER